jgi:hypothetical protein
MTSRRPAIVASFDEYSRLAARLVPAGTPRGPVYRFKNRRVLTGAVFPFTRTSKSSASSESTGAPLLPTTVTSRRMRSTPVLKVGWC